MHESKPHATAKWRLSGSFRIGRTPRLPKNLRYKFITTRLGTRFWHARQSLRNKPSVDNVGDLIRFQNSWMKEKYLYIRDNHVSWKWKHWEPFPIWNSFGSRFDPQISTSVSRLSLDESGINPYKVGFLAQDASLKGPSQNWDSSGFKMRDSSQCGMLKSKPRWKCRIADVREFQNQLHHIPPKKSTLQVHREKLQNQVLDCTSKSKEHVECKQSWWP